MDEIIRQAKEHLFAAATLPYPQGVVLTPQWQAQRDKNRQAILKMKTVEEAITWAQTISDSGFNHRGVGNADSLGRQMDAFSKRWTNSATLSLEHFESPLSRPETLTWVGDRLVSNIWFWHMEALMRVLVLQPMPLRILEIGGGLGELAGLAAQNGEFMWLITDVPESLFFSEVFLRANGVRVDYQLAGMDMSSRNVGLLPIQFAPRFQSGNSLTGKVGIDLVMSQGSLQEMTPETVLWWWNLVNDSTAKYFLSINSKTSINFQWRPEEWEVLHQEHNTPSLQVVLDSGADFEELVLKRKQENG